MRTMITVKTGTDLAGDGVALAMTDWKKLVIWLMVFGIAVLSVNGVTDGDGEGA